MAGALVPVCGWSPDCSARQAQSELGSSTRLEVSLLSTLLRNLNFNSNCCMCAGGGGWLHNQAAAAKVHAERGVA